MNNKQYITSITQNKSVNSKKGIIVGYDPGLTVGIAILDLQGEILSLESFKEISRAEIINHIIRYGKPIILSTDVYPPSKTVKKAASILNAKIDSPDKDMSVESKIELVGSYLKEKSDFISSDSPNTHERDALAAAIRTYKNYQSKLLLVENRGQSAGLSSQQVEDIKIMFIKGKAISTAIQSVVEMNISKEENINKNSANKNNHIKNESPCTVNPNLVSKYKHRIKAQERQIKNLKARNNILNKEIKGYKNDISKLNHRIDKLYYEYNNNLLYDKEMSSKISLIKKLQDNYNQEKALRMELEEQLESMTSIYSVNPSENVIPVKIIETFTKEGILKACEYWKIKRDDMVLLKSSEGGGSQTASLLINMGVKAVLILDKISHYAEEEFERNRVPLLKINQVDLNFIDQFAIIDNEVLELELNNWNVKTENKMHQENNQEILNVIDEYRAKRRRLVDPIKNHA